MLEAYRRPILKIYFKFDRDRNFSKQPELFWNRQENLSKIKKTLKGDNTCLVGYNIFQLLVLHCEKRLAIFPSPAGMSPSSWPGIIFIIPAQGEFGQ
jgi:hypothetical protein